MKIGIGYDVHKLVKNRKLIVGGVEIDHEMGLYGHSDADVLIHAIMDALIGALALGDIGKHFPDDDNDFKGISSMILLEKVAGLIEDKGFRVTNIDSIIVAQRPKMAPHIDNMRENIAEILKINVDQVSVKATTTERLGFEGREEGISAQAVCLLEYLKV